MPSQGNSFVFGQWGGNPLPVCAKSLRGTGFIAHVDPAGTVPGRTMAQKERISARRECARASERERDDANKIKNTCTYRIAGKKE